MIKNTDIRNKFLCYFPAIVVVLCICSTFIMQGLICNDELQSLLLRLNSFWTLVSTTFIDEFKKGRWIRALAPFNLSLGFPTCNIYLNRIVQVAMLLFSFALFGYFLNKVFRNKKFSLMVIAVLLCFLPVAFEHSLPNSFIALVTVPMIMLLLALLAFLKYIETGSTRYWVVSAVLFFLSLLGYEFLIVYVLLFPILSFSQKREKVISMRLILIQSLPVIAVSIIYIAGYFISNWIFPTLYPGTQLGFISVGNSLSIIFTLFKSSLPGYYLFNFKYISYIFSINGSMLSLNSLFSVKIILLLVCLPFIFYTLMDEWSNHEIKNKTSMILIIVFGLFFAVFPAVSISISVLYQHMVSPSKYVGLPLSSFMYFASVFTGCFILWITTGRVKKHSARIFVSILLTVAAVAVQFENNLFAEEQNRNYTRIENIQKLFQTKILRQYDSCTVASEDLFQRNHLLAVNAEYWTEFTKTLGLNMNVVQGTNGEINIFVQSDNCFVVKKDNKITVITYKKLSGFHPVKIGEHLFATAEFVKVPIVSDNSIHYWKYNFNTGKGGELIPIVGGE